MKNFINPILLSTMLALSVAESAAASSLSFKNVVTQIRSPVCTVNIGNVNCSMNPTFANNPAVCQPQYLNNYENELWGVGQPNMTWHISGTLSGPDGVYLPPPEIGDENPNNLVNVAFFKNPATTPLDPFFGVGPISFYLIPTCIHVEQDNQGAKLAVVRLLARLTLFPGFVVEEPELWLIKQDQNGRDRMALSAGTNRSLTTCTLEDAQNSVTDPEGIGLPPNPPGFTSDNLFKLLSTITSGNITPKK
jgi:hypothetical protein